jgi:hypothetical protein
MSLKESTKILSSNIDISMFNNNIPIYIYIHVCCIGSYEEIFNDLIFKIKTSGLYHVVKEIRCCVLGKTDNVKPFIFNKDPKIVLKSCSDELLLYETFTINRIYEDSKKESFYCLYLHTKGVTRSEDIFVKHWVDYMCYFNIYNYERCIKLLENNDTVGVELLYKQDTVFDNPCHYSGNFWWSKSSYIKRLSSCGNLTYNDPEFWLTRNENGKYVSLWNSNCSVLYHELYEKEKYSNKKIVPYVYDFTSLDSISKKYFLDKNVIHGFHNYIPGYISLFENVRHTVKTVVEIGIGSIENDQMLHLVNLGYKTGNSLKCWNEYFSNAHIYGIDIFHHSELDTEMITTFVADQNNESELQDVVDYINRPLDIVIDDGSHEPEHQMCSFMFFSKFLSKNGIYVIESIQPEFIKNFMFLNIFPDFCIDYIEKNFIVKYFDTRETLGREDDFMIAFIRK